MFALENVPRVRKSQGFRLVFRPVLACEYRVVMDTQTLGEPRTVYVHTSPPAGLPVGPAREVACCEYLLGWGLAAPGPNARQYIVAPRNLPAAK